MTTYREADFNGCKYNPLAKDFEERAEALIGRVPVTYARDRIALVKYVIMMYDPNSLLRRQYSSIEQRQRIAAHIAGMDLVNDGNFITEQVYSMNSQEVVDVIDDYLKNEVKERLAYIITANEQTFYEYGRRLLEPIDASKSKGEKDLLSAISIKTKLSEDMAAINERLEKDIAKFYEDDSKLIKLAVKGKFRPEDMSTRVG